LAAGDNEWTECANVNESQGFWRLAFDNLNERYWPQSKRDLNVTRKLNRRENFSFVKNGVLFIGLNIVGGKVTPNRPAWDAVLTDEYIWAADLMTKYKKSTDLTKTVGRMVLFFHANPNSNHKAFFDPFSNYVKNVLNNTVPILFVHGDEHKWLYTPNYMGLKSVLRISLVGETKNPPLKLTVNANGKSVTTLSDAFIYDRRL
jgi:hypothetical protein